MGLDGSAAVTVAGHVHWLTWRALRLRSLATDPDAFGSALDRERAFTETDWRSRLRGGRARLARLDGAYVGMGGWFEPEPGQACVVAMWTAPEARGRGVGSAVLVDLLADPALAGREVWLWVADGNPARRLYERAGFESTGERTPIRPGATLLKERMTRGPCAADGR